MQRLPTVSCLTLCLAAAGCATADNGGIPPAEMTMLQAEAKAGMNQPAGTQKTSVDAMLAKLRGEAAPTAPAAIGFTPGAVDPSKDALQGLLGARPAGAGVARIAVGGSAGAPPIDGAALALRRGRALASALGQPAADLAFDPRLPDDTARVDWTTGATQGG